MKDQKRFYQAMITFFVVAIMILSFGIILRGAEAKPGVPQSSGITAEQRAAFWRATLNLQQAAAARDASIKDMTETCARVIGQQLGQDEKGEPKCVDKPVPVEAKEK